MSRPDAPEPLPHPVVDNHCHLDMGLGGEVLPVGDALAASAAVGVPRIVQIGCDLAGARWAVQHESFRRHIDLAKRLGKTLVIHDRDSHDDVLSVVDDEGAPERVVMHCFSGDAAFARRCLDRGFWLSFAGTVTFKNAQDLRDALVVAPPDRVLVETDAPYLTPMPYRGRPNASYLIPLTMRVMAETRGADLGELCAAVEANTFAAFGGAW